MLPETLRNRLEGLEPPATQPANRWAEFATDSPDARGQSLGEQVLYLGMALAALGSHPEAGPEERERAAAGLAACVDRLAQRRVWATWAAAEEQAGRMPDPVEGGHAALVGGLATLLGLAAALGDTRYASEPLTLHWSSGARFAYSHPALIAAVGRQLAADQGGAMAGADDTVTPTAMARVLWGLRLCGDAEGRGAAWLTTLEQRVALRGPRLPGRGALAAAYHPRRRRATLGSDLLGDAEALALTAALAPDLAARLAERHWPAARRLLGREQPLAAAFAALAAQDLGQPGLAEGLRAAAAAAEDQLLVRSLLTIGAAGGLAALLARTAPA